MLANIEPGGADHHLFIAFVRWAIFTRSLERAASPRPCRLWPWRSLGPEPPISKESVAGHHQPALAIDPQRVILHIAQGPDSRFRWPVRLITGVAATYQQIRSRKAIPATPRQRAKQPDAAVRRSQCVPQGLAQRLDPRLPLQAEHLRKVLSQRLMGQPYSPTAGWRRVNSKLCASSLEAARGGKIWA
jgi:hypothetical protein